MMSEKSEYIEVKVICNGSGSTVLEVLGHKREFAVQSLINVLQEAQQDGHNYGEDREKGMVTNEKLSLTYGIQLPRLRE